MDPGFVCLNVHTAELCPPARLMSKRPHTSSGGRGSWGSRSGCWVSEVWRENEDKGQSLNYQQTSGGVGSEELVPRGPPTLYRTGRLCFSFQLGPPAPRTPSSMGSRASSAAIWRAGPGDSAWPRVTVWGTAGLSLQTGTEKRVLLSPLSQLCFKERPSDRSQTGKKYESVSRSVLSDSVRPRGLWPDRLLCPWDSPGKNTGVG